MKQQQLITNVTEHIVTEARRSTTTPAPLDVMTVRAERYPDVPVDDWPDIAAEAFELAGELLLNEARELREFRSRA